MQPAPIEGNPINGGFPPQNPTFFAPIINAVPPTVIIPPTDVPPDEPPVDVPPEDIPPVDVPPEDIPPVNVPPVDTPPEEPPTDVPEPASLLILLAGALAIWLFGRREKPSKG